jgi:hypothetical protein
LTTRQRRPVATFAWEVSKVTRPADCAPRTCVILIILRKSRSTYVRSRGRKRSKPRLPHIFALGEQVSGDGGLGTGHRYLDRTRARTPHAFDVAVGAAATSLPRTGEVSLTLTLTSTFSLRSRRAHDSPPAGHPSRDPHPYPQACARAGSIPRVRTATAAGPTWKNDLL